jgi:glycosyltransferase involved in cell wall biosynthesis
MKTRVCHIITKLELGGAQQNTVYTVAHLDPARFDADLVTGTEGILVADLKASGVRAHLLDSLDRHVSPWRDLAALRDLVLLLRRERPHIVHTHSSKAGILGRWAATLAGVSRIVHSIHGYGFHDAQPRLQRELFMALERVTGRFATSAFVAVSQANIDKGIDLGILPAGRVSLIRSGVKLSEYSPRGGEDGTHRPLTVGMVACLKPQKAPLDFVKVASRVARGRGGGRAVRFILAGDGELRPDVEAMIRAEGLESMVTLVGWRRDVPSLMREFDLLLHTSRWEGLPRVFPEAMATGLPIVATRVDGAPEAVEDGVTGFLVPAGDIEGLARRTLDLLEDAGLRRRMGEAALSRVGPWDIDQMVRRQERLYESLMAGDAGRSAELSTQWEGS